MYSSIDDCKSDIPCMGDCWFPNGSKKVTSKWQCTTQPGHDTSGGTSFAYTACLKQGHPNNGKCCIDKCVGNLGCGDTQSGHFADCETSEVDARKYSLCDKGPYKSKCCIKDRTMPPYSGYTV